MSKPKPESKSQSTPMETTPQTPNGKLQTCTLIPTPVSPKNTCHPSRNSAAPAYEYIIDADCNVHTLNSTRSVGAQLLCLLCRSGGSADYDFQHFISSLPAAKALWTDLLSTIQHRFPTSKSAKPITVALLERDSNYNYVLATGKHMCGPKRSPRFFTLDFSRPVIYTITSRINAYPAHIAQYMTPNIITGLDEDACDALVLTPIRVLVDNQTGGAQTAPEHLLVEVDDIDNPNHKSPPGRLPKGAAQALRGAGLHGATIMWKGRVYQVK